MTSSEQRSCSYWLIRVLESEFIATTETHFAGSRLSRDGMSGAAKLSRNSLISGLGDRRAAHPANCPIKAFYTVRPRVSSCFLIVSTKARAKHF